MVVNSFFEIFGKSGKNRKNWKLFPKLYIENSYLKSLFIKFFLLYIFIVYIIYIYYIKNEKIGKLEKIGKKKEKI